MVAIRHIANAINNVGNTALKNSGYFLNSSSISISVTVYRQIHIRNIMVHRYHYILYEKHRLV